MAIIAPFRGLTYRFNNKQDFSKLVAPPYDVISADQQDALYRIHPHNVIRLILGKKKVGDSDWDNKYTRAADFFKRWESQGILLQTDLPSLYVTSMSYDVGNGDARRTRWGIIALVRIEEEASGIILPHEKTFSAHKDDRLKLMRACSAQFSQIFALYEDPDDFAMEICRNVTNAEPEVCFDLQDGTSHGVWIIQTPSIFREVSRILNPKSFFIADGHHRYETARRYRNLMRARYGRRPANRSYEYTMMYLTNLNHEGLTILSSHRMIAKAPGFRTEPFLKCIEAWFDIRKVPLPDQDPSSGFKTFREALSNAGESGPAIGFYCKEVGSGYLFSLKNGMREEMGDDLHPALKNLDVLVLSRFLLQKALGFRKVDLDNERIFQYESSMKTALSLVHSGQFQMTFLLNPTRMDQVKEIARLSLVMPRKSTYFYPKVISGLVLNRIDPHDIIKVP